MTKGQKTNTTLLAVIAVLLGLNLLVTGSFPGSVAAQDDMEFDQVFALEKMAQEIANLQVTLEVLAERASNAKAVEDARLPRNSIAQPIYVIGDKPVAVALDKPVAVDLEVTRKSGRYVVWTLYSDGRVKSEEQQP